MPGQQSVVCPVIIGRDGPMSTVLHTLVRAQEGHGSTLLISGEAGIGKSRLLRAMIDRARSMGFAVLQGASYEADRAQPYAPILDLVYTLAATASPAVAAHYFGLAEAELVTLFPELRTVFPEGRALEALTPEEERRRLFHSLTDACFAIARLQPLMLVIEDVHWSDDATLDLLLHLARRAGTQRMALALTFRSDEVGAGLARVLADLDRARCAAEVMLRPLGGAEVSAMLQAIFGAGASFESSFVNELHALTEGNPFFVEEMLKSMLVAGELQRVNGVWRARPLEQSRVPRTATEAVGRRLAGLSEAARRVASVAAVAGRGFDFALLQELTHHAEESLLALVKELVAAQLVVEESADRFAFRHALTRETIRSQLLGRERVALHRAIAAWLERTSDGRTEESADALAYHCYEAGEWEAAQKYAMRAATHALALCAPREALQHLERGALASERSGGGPDIALLMARGRARETLGAFAQAHDDFSAALGAARESGDLRGEWGALYALGMLWAARDYERVGGYRRDALAVARRLNDEVLVAHSLNRVGNWHVNRDDPQAGIPHHTEALAIFERAHDARGVAETLDLLAMSHHIGGHEVTAVEFNERAVAHFQALGDKRGLTNAWAVIAVSGPSHHSSAWRVADGKRMREIVDSERAVQAAMEIEWRAGEAFARYLVADCLLWRGKYERSLQLATKSLEIAREIEHLEWECGARRVLGSLALDLGDFRGAVTELEGAHRIARKLGSATWMRWTGACYAIGLATVGESTRALALIDEVEERTAIRDGLETAQRAVTSGEASQTLGQRYLTLARAMASLGSGNPHGALATLGDDVAGIPRRGYVRGRALTAVGALEEGEQTLRRAREDAEAEEALPLVWRIVAAQGELHLAARRRREARAAFDEARALAGGLTAEGAVDGNGRLVQYLRSHAALIDLYAPPPPPPTRRQAAKAEHGGLTKRERDAAALIAQGKSNRAIAKILGIGERTVEGYVASALAKLGFSSRAQIAVWANEQGLGGGTGGDAPRAEWPRQLHRGNTKPR